jgi:hypothetical protein
MSLQSIGLLTLVFGLTFAIVAIVWCESARTVPFVLLTLLLCSASVFVVMGKITSATKADKDVKNLVSQMKSKRTELLH